MSTRLLLAVFLISSLFPAPLPAQSASERQELVLLSDELVDHLRSLVDETSRGASPTARRPSFRRLVEAALEDAQGLRAALRGSRALDLDDEMAAVRESLRLVDDRIHARRRPDAPLREHVQGALRAFRALRQEYAGMVGPGRGPASAPAGGGAELPVRLERLAGHLAYHAQRAAHLARSDGRAFAHVDRLAAEASVFHRQIRDGQLSSAQARGRVASLARDFDQATREIGAPGTQDLSWEWKSVGDLVKEMRRVMGA